MIGFTTTAVHVQDPETNDTVHPQEDEHHLMVKLKTDYGSLNRDYPY